MDDEQTTDLLAAIDGLSSSVRAIAHGGTSGPGGLEGLAMAFAGTGLELPVAAAVQAGFSEVADAIREGFAELAEAHLTVASRGGKP